MKQYATFATVGMCNTIIDLVAYSLLIAAGVSLWIAVVLSTSLGLVCSFVLNRRFTFGAETRLGTDTIVSFLCVTLAGLWLLQPLVVNGLVHAFALTATIGLVVAKLIATGVTMIWNFSWYRWYVFR